MYEIICNVLKENYVRMGLILTGTLKSGHENVLKQENLLSTPVEDLKGNFKSPK